MVIEHLEQNRPVVLQGVALRSGCDRTDGGEVPSAGELLELTEAVINPEDHRVVWLRAVNNKKVGAGTTTLNGLRAAFAADPQLATSRMFSVRVRPEVIAIDVDDASADPQVAEFLGVCSGLGVEVVEVDSGRFAHRHLWARPDDEHTHAVLVNAARALGLELRTGNSMRPPGAANALGAVRVKGGVRRAIRVLSTGQRLNLPAVAPQRAPLPDPGVAGAERSHLAPLSAQCVNVLRHGDGNADRSRTFQRVVTSMLNAGWSLNAAWDVLSRGSFAGAAKFNDRLERYGPQAAFDYLQVCWTAAERFVAAHPVWRDDNRVQLLVRAQRCADRHLWEGEAGATDWMVLHRLIVLGAAAGTATGNGVTVLASQRQLAEDAGVARASVHRSLHRLCEEGWLVCVETGEGPKASLWRIADTESRTAGPLDQHPPIGGCDEVIGLNVRGYNDAFRRGALGCNGYRIVRALLLYGPASTSELAESLRLHPGTVRRLVTKRIAAADVVECVSGRWTLRDHVVGSSPSKRMDDAALDVAATMFGTSGRFHRQRARHHRERQTYLAWWRAQRRSEALVDLRGSEPVVDLTESSGPRHLEHTHV